MKNLLYLLFFCSCAIMAQEQKYILLDSLTQKFNFNKYTINAMPYGYHQGIDIYNVWINTDEFLLLSVFPETESGNKWEKISLEAFL